MNFVENHARFFHFILLAGFFYFVDPLKTPAPIFMQYDGIDGDVTAAGHEKWIELQSCQFGIENRPAQSGGSSTPSVSEIVISKEVDIASPKLFEKTCMGDRTTTITLDFLKPVGSTAKQVKYLEYKLTNCLVTSYQTSVNNTLPTESLSLNFTKITYTYTHYNDTGQALGSVTSTCDVSNFTPRTAVAPENLQLE